MNADKQTTISHICCNKNETFHSTNFKRDASKVTTPRLKITGNIIFVITTSNFHQIR